MTGTVIAIIAIGVTVIIAMIGAAATAVRTSWSLRGWLAEEFTSTRKIFHEAIAAHEAVDQQRHEENLERFSDIGKALARAGLNGQGRPTDHH